MGKMNPELWAKAQQLASSGYTVSISDDTLSNGEKVYVLEHPELPGCIAHGTTLDEANRELREAAISYIYYLLEDGQEVPSPMSSWTVTTTTSSPGRGKTLEAIKITYSSFTTWRTTEEADETLDKTQSERGKQSMNISVIEGNLA